MSAFIRINNLSRSNIAVESARYRRAVVQTRLATKFDTLLDNCTDNCTCSITFVKLLVSENMVMSSDYVIPNADRRNSHTKQQRGSSYLFHIIISLVPLPIVHYITTANARFG